MSTPADQPDLITWLRAALDDDERALDAYDEFNRGLPVTTIAVPPGCMLGEPLDPNRQRAEVDAKRRILDEVLKYEATIDGEWGDGHTAEQIGAGLCPETDPDEIPALRVLALPYADRPGYREEWKP